MPSSVPNRKILVVDDEATVAETLDLILRTRNYEPRVAYSAEEAIEIVALWKPDLAVLDVMLPGMNGIDLAVALKAIYPDLKILLVSGHPGTGDLLVTAEEEGHRFEILAKPLHPDLLLEKVSSLLPVDGRQQMDS